MIANQDQTAGGPGPREMTALCRSFPSLRAKAGTEPWDALAFARTFSGGQSESEKQAAAFILSVWSSSTTWNAEPYCVGTFNFVRAYFLWDADHRAAFRAWCDAPFWP
jgi:hypothetical protein